MAVPPTLSQLQRGTGLARRRGRWGLQWQHSCAVHVAGSSLLWLLGLMLHAATPLLPTAAGAAVFELGGGAPVPVLEVKARDPGGAVLDEQLAGKINFVVLAREPELATLACALLHRNPSVHCEHALFPFQGLVAKNGQQHFWDVPWDADPGRPMVQPYRTLIKKALAKSCREADATGAIACGIKLQYNSISVANEAFFLRWCEAQGVRVVHAVEENTVQAINKLATHRMQGKAGALSADAVARRALNMALDTEHMRTAVMAFAPHAALEVSHGLLAVHPQRACLMQLGFFSADLLNTLDAGEECRTAPTDGIFARAGSLLPLNLSQAHHRHWVNPCSGTGTGTSSDSGSGIGEGGAGEGARVDCAYFTCGLRGRMDELTAIADGLKAEVGRSPSGVLLNVEFTLKQMVTQCHEYDTGPAALYDFA